MEFKYRAVDKNDKKPTTTTTTSFPHSTATYVSESSLPGASSLSCLPTNAFRLPAVGDVLLRELEKEQIRREIIASEIARRRELEAEVRRELALERSLGGIQMQRYLGAPHSVQQRVNPTAVDDVIGVSQTQLEPIESPVEIKPSSPQIDKEKVIVLAKPKPDHDPSAKRKAVAPAVCDTEPSASGLSKKAKREWSCALCQVIVTSEASFNKHLAGRKHKAKEASVTTQTIGLDNLDATPNRESTEPSLILEELNQTVVDKGVMETKNEELAQLVEKNHNIGGLENPSETVTEEAGRTNASARKKVLLWCEVCQIRTPSHAVMETHKKGKQHQKQMMKLSQN